MEINGQSFKKKTLKINWNLLGSKEKKQVIEIHQGRLKIIENNCNLLRLLENNWKSMNFN